MTLPAGGFAVYASGPKSGIGDIVADSTTDRPVVVVDGGRIRVLTPYTTLTLHNLSGLSLPVDTQLTPGVYIVNVDGTPVKVAVR